VTVLEKCMGFQIFKRKIPMCNFDKVFASFWHLTRKNLHPKKAHVNWHAQFRFWHVVGLVKKQIACHLTCTTKHVTLRQHFKRKNNSQLTFIFVFENITWHSGVEIEHQIKIVKHIYTPNIDEFHLESSLMLYIFKLSTPHNLPMVFRIRNSWCFDEIPSS
jgi:hypothetical protein